VIVLTLDRALALLHHRGPTRALTAAIESQLRVGDLGEALSIAAANRGAFARVATRVLREGLGPIERADAARSEGLALERPRLERRMGSLAIVGSVATLFGLWGSVTDMFLPVHLPSTAPSKGAAIALAVAHALHSTFAGLVVMVLAGAAYFAVRLAVTKRVAMLEAESRGLVNLLATHRERLRWLGQRPYVESLGYRR
jgi:biopolymer transport protein ExbB/TolQ